METIAADEMVIEYVGQVRLIKRSTAASMLTSYFGHLLTFFHVSASLNGIDRSSLIINIYSIIYISIYYYSLLFTMYFINSIIID